MEWAKFRRYHYLDNDISPAAMCYGLYDDDNIIAFIGVLHQPHSKIKNLKRCSRLVVLPDYQGIGLGTKFLTAIAKMYQEHGFDFSITTSAKNMIMALNRSQNWIMSRYGANRSSNNENSIDFKRKTMRTNCKTATFFLRKKI